MINEKVELKMTDENVCCGGEGAETCSTPKAEPRAVAIQKLCKDRVKEQSDNVESRVVAKLVEEEVSRRADVLRKAIDKRNELWKELSKIKPDQIFYSVNDNGQKVKGAEHWSKEQADKLEKAQKAVNKLDKQIDKAIDEADYSELSS